MRTVISAMNDERVITGNRNSGRSVKFFVTGKHIIVVHHQNERAPRFIRTDSDEARFHPKASSSFETIKSEAFEKSRTDYEMTT